MSIARVGLIEGTSEKWVSCDSKRQNESSRIILKPHGLIGVRMSRITSTSSHRMKRMGHHIRSARTNAIAVDEYQLLYIYLWCIYLCSLE